MGVVRSVSGASAREGGGGEKTAEGVRLTGELEERRWEPLGAQAVGEGCGLGAFSGPVQPFDNDEDAAFALGHARREVALGGRGGRQATADEVRRA
jgi:hypothetical protein